MKATLLLVVLAVLTAGSSGSLIRASAARANLNVGYYNNGDRLLHRAYLYQPPIPNTIQYQDVVYRGNLTTVVTAIQATELGSTQYASAWLLSGGVGYNNATVRVQSARGYGYYYLVDIWGR